MTQPPYSDSGSWPDPAQPDPARPDPPGPAHSPPGQPLWNPPPEPPPLHPVAGPPGYGQPGGMPGYGYPQPPKTNAMAVAAMVVSIGSTVALVCAACITLLAILPLGGGVTGAILGLVARRQIRERGEQGDGMALAGIIIGFITATLALLAIAVMVVFLGYGMWYGSFT